MILDRNVFKLYSMTHILHFRIYQEKVCVLLHLQNKGKTRIRLPAYENIQKKVLASRRTKTISIQKDIKGTRKKKELKFAVLRSVF